MPETIKPIKAPGNGFAPFAVALCFLTGCGGVAGSRKLVPPPTKLSDYQPPNAFSERANGLLGRSVFRSPDGEAFRVGFEDLVVPPAPAAVVVPLSEAAVIEVRSGEGDAAAGDRRIALKQGTTFAVAAGEKLTIQPRGGPMQLRVVEIGSR